MHRAASCGSGACARCLLRSRGRVLMCKEIIMLQTSSVRPAGSFYRSYTLKLNTRRNTCEKRPYESLSTYARVWDSLMKPWT